MVYIAPKSYKYSSPWHYSHMFFKRNQSDLWSPWWTYHIPFPLAASQLAPQTTICIETTLVNPLFPLKILCKNYPKSKRPASGTFPKGQRAVCFNGKHWKTIKKPTTQSFPPAHITRACCCSAHRRIKPRGSDDPRWYRRGSHGGPLPPEKVTLRHVTGRPRVKR